MEFSLIIVLFVFGALGGFLSGLLGIGGGIVFVPILTTVLHQVGMQDPEVAKYVLANSFAGTFFAGAISTFKQYKLNQFYPKEILLTAALAIPASLLITRTIADGSWYNERVFNLFFIVLLIATLVRFLWSKPNIKENKTQTQKWKYSLTGLITGVISGLSGLGGGVIMVPLFTQVLKLNIKKAAAISIGVIPTVMVPVLIMYASYKPAPTVFQWQIGYLLPGVFLPLVAGLLFAAPMGVIAGQRATSKTLRTIFALLIFIIILKTLAELI